MNKGRICISVSASTAGAICSQIAKADALGDVIELRFDRLEPGEPEKLLTGLPNISGRYLFTFRPLEQGGARELSRDQRIEFWQKVAVSSGMNDHLCDIEEDLAGLPLGLDPSRLIVSDHSLDGERDPAAMFVRLKQINAVAVKIADRTERITDSIRIWNLLRHSETGVIPIAMGEAGKWTRILGPAYGAYMTYASLGPGSETAPGQISAADMIEVFRVRELNQNTKIYAIIAGDTSYSVSPYIHNAAFKAAGLNSVFVPLQADDLDTFIRRMVRSETRETELNFHGFSVTNPHKRSIMRHLDHIDEKAAAIGAVNTVKIDNGKFFGYNTDADGFIEPLIRRLGEIGGMRAAVIGAGGAARACVYSLIKNGAEVTVLARDTGRAAELASAYDIQLQQLGGSGFELEAFDILVNATPIGTHGLKENDTPFTAKQMSGLKLVYDLIYNPPVTQLVKEAEAAGVAAISGLEMLIAQAAEQFAIWTGRTPPLEEMNAAAQKRLKL